MKKIVITILMLILPCMVLTGCNSKPSPVAIRAVWWWSSNLEEEVVDEYLNFAYDNGINSIYYCSSEFGEKTNGFIEKAKKKNMKVYWLDGYYKWLTSDTYQAQLFDKIDKYLDYNANYPDNAFSGVHLDIEPHQSPDFKTNRTDLILKLIALADKLKQTYKTINFTYDIPFWLHDEIEYNGVTKPAYAHMMWGFSYVWTGSRPRSGLQIVPWRSHHSQCRSWRGTSLGSSCTAFAEINACAYRRKTQPLRCRERCG